MTRKYGHEPGHTIQNNMSIKVSKKCDLRWNIDKIILASLPICYLFPSWSRHERFTASMFVSITQCTLDSALFLPFFTQFFHSDYRYDRMSSYFQGHARSDFFLRRGQAKASQSEVRCTKSRKNNLNISILCDHRSNKFLISLLTFSPFVRCEGRGTVFDALDRLDNTILS